eukprot:s2340_g7.t1
MCDFVETTAADCIILSPTCHASDVWPDTEDSEGVLSPISKQIADLCGELESSSTYPAWICRRQWSKRIEHAESNL